jgi:hypothetical protein
MSVSNLQNDKLDEIKDAINNWGNKGFFRKQNVGNEIQIEDVQSLECFSVKIKTQYEQRTIRSASEPYRGGSISKYHPPNRWQIDVDLPTSFQNLKNSFAVPNSDSVDDCSSCSGRGKTDCSRCHGSGKINCYSCNGTGGVPAQDYHGNQGMVPCGACRGGKRDCSTCYGKKQVTCSACAGCGQLKFYQILDVRFHLKEQLHWINPSDIKSKKLNKVSGEILVNEHRSLIKGFSGVSTEVTDAVKELMVESQHTNHDEERVLFQNLIIERIGIQKITITSSGNSRNDLWIFGNEKEVQFVGSQPLNKLRVSVVLLISLTAILAIIILSTSPNRASNSTGQNTSQNQQKNSNSKVKQSLPKVAVIKTQAADMFSKLPNSNNSTNIKLMELKLGERLELLSPKYFGKGWYHVKHPQTGQEGWINGNQIDVE